MSDLRLAHILLLVLLNVLLISKIFGSTKWGLDKQTLWEIQQMVIAVFVLLSLTEFALGRVIDGIVSMVFAGGVYYLYRRRNGGGGKKKKDESLFGKYSPW